jgi:CheY-like chemotaxis protein
MEMQHPFILMLEHDDDDRFITDLFFKEHAFDVHIEFISNSDQFFAFLGECKEPGYPSLILLNISSAPMNGAGILKKIKSIEAYKHIPVVVLSADTNQEMVKECYALGASSFIQKPETLEDTQAKILHFLKYWFETVELS